MHNFLTFYKQLITPKKQCHHRTEQLARDQGIPQHSPLQAESILQNQIEVKMSDDIEVCRLYDDLRIITYI